MLAVVLMQPGKTQNNLDVKAHICTFINVLFASISNSTVTFNSPQDAGIEYFLFYLENLMKREGKSTENGFTPLAI